MNQVKPKTWEEKNSNNREEGTPIKFTKCCKMYQTSKVWKWRIIQNNLRDKGVDAENSSKTTGKKSVSSQMLSC